MITPLEAARLIRMDYERDDLDPVIAHRAQMGDQLDVGGVHASIVESIDGVDKILIIRGTDQMKDWLRYNFPMLASTSHVYGATCKWHRGFMSYADVVYPFAKDKGITQVIGHSLGAGAAQIVAPALNVLCIAFASPHSLYGDDQPPNAANVVNYCRPDDLVTKLPPSFMGFGHVGNVKWLMPNSIHVGEDHRIEHYIDLLD